MKARSSLLPITALILIIAFSACTASGGSIYATIETEKKINVSTLDQTITVFDLLNIGSGPLPYFVAAGAVYIGSVADGSNSIGWPDVGKTPTAISPPSSGALCLALTYFPSGTPPNRLYGGFFTSDTSVAGLYQSASSAQNYSFASSEAAPIADPLVAGKQITFLAADATNLFAVTATLASGTTGFTYALNFSADGVNFTAGTALTDPKRRITGVGFLGSTYYMTSGSTLYSGPAPDSLVGTSTIGTFTIDSGDELRGVTVDSGYIVIPSRNGAVYYSQDGSAWSKASTSDQVIGSVVGFLTVSTRVGTSGPVFLVGADGAGFYTLNVANNTLSKFSDVTVTGLYAGAVRRILVDPAHSNTVFMGTAGTGLWRANFDPATGSVNSSWIHE